MEEKEKKYPVLRAFSKPVAIWVDCFKTFAVLGGVTALVLVLISFAFGQSFVCMLPKVRGDSYCGENLPAYIFYMFVKFFVIAVFLRVWGDRIFLNKNINMDYFKKNIGRFLMFFGVFLAFLFINILPAFALYFMIVRVPNPIWQIEILYFVFMSLGFVIPFVLLRFYRNIALFVLDKPCFDLKETYVKTSFKTSRIFLSFAVVLAICLVFFLVVNANLKAHVFEPLVIYNFVAEYIFEAVVLIVATLIFNFITVQKEILE